MPRLLHHCTAKNRCKFGWTSETLDSFESLKKIVISSLFPTYLDTFKPLILDCDANDEGISGVLWQRYVNNSELAIADFGKDCIPAEKNF